MNKHKNQAKAQLEHLINRNSATGCLLAKRPLLDCPLFVNSTHGHSNLLHNKIDDQTLLMLQHLKGYQNYYLRLMEAERSKFCEHFDQMFKILKEQCEVGLFHIDKSIEQLRDIFDRKQHSIKNAKKDLMRKQNLRRLKLQDKLQNLAREMTFEIVLLDVQLSDLTNFRADVRKYLVGPVENIFAGCHQPDIPELQAQAGQVTHQLPTKDMATQTENYGGEAFQGREEEMDDLLGCDEDMGVKLSASTRRRRKYQVGRRDVIKEEDESSQNSVISEN